MNRAITLPASLSPRLATALENLGASISDKERREMRRALGIAQREMIDQLEVACRLEDTIDELSSELRDARTDYDEGVVTLSLEKARKEYTAAIHASAAAMSVVSDLRERLGMQPHPMIAIKAPRS